MFWDHFEQQRVFRIVSSDPVCTASRRLSRIQSIYVPSSVKLEVHSALLVTILYRSHELSQGRDWLCMPSDTYFLGLEESGSYACIEAAILKIATRLCKLKAMNIRGGGGRCYRLFLDYENDQIKTIVYNDKESLKALWRYHLNHYKVKFREPFPSPAEAQPNVSIFADDM